MIKETFQDLNRMRQIGQIAGRHGFGQLLERAGFWRLVGRREQVEPSPEGRRASAARRFRMLLEDLGPSFVKLGQILSTRADLLPAEYVDELASLQDQVPPFPLAEARAEIERSLGKPIGELFSEIVAEPLAAASIAQVHRATTLTGEQVVVKVQRPGIQEQIRADLVVLRRVARLLEAVVEETGIYSPVGIVEEFEKAILDELDFQHEAANVREFQVLYGGRAGVKIPAVHSELTSRTVLTLEFIEGIRLTDAELSKEQREALARRIIDLAFKQLFVDGLFHGDPHPGNMLVLPDGGVALLDFGVTGRISRQMQQTMVMLVVAIALRDADSVARIIYRVGVPEGRADLSGFRDDVEQLLGQYMPTTLGEVNAQALLRDLLDLAVKYRIRIPKDYALLSRASISLEGVLRSLYPDLKITEVALPYAKQLLAERYDPTQLQGGVLKALFRLQSLASDLPVQLSQILMDLETGKFAVNVRSEQLEKLNDSLRSATVIAFMGLCACGFIVGAFLAFAQNPWTWRGIPVVGLIGISLAAALFGATLGWYLVAPRVHKVRLSEYFKKRR